LPQSAPLPIDSLHGARIGAERKRLLIASARFAA